jgi:hypothetical protein
MEELAMAIKFATDAGLDLLTIDGSGGGTGMSPWNMMQSWGVPSITLHSKAYEYASILAAKGLKVVDMSFAGGFALEDSIFKGLALGAPFTKLICMGRGIMIPGFVGSNIEGALNYERARRVNGHWNELPKTVLQVGSSAKEIFACYHDVEKIVGKDEMKNVPYGAIAPAPLRIINRCLEIRFDDIGQVFPGSGKDILVRRNTNENQPVTGTFFGGHQTGFQVFRRIVVVVDAGKVVIHAKQPCRSPFAGLAPQTAHFTDGFHVLSRIVVGALHHQHAVGLERGHGDDVAGAGLGTGTAAHTFFVIHTGQSIFNVDGIEITGPGTVTEPQAAVGASLNVGHQVGRTAALFTFVGSFFPICLLNGRRSAPQAARDNWRRPPPP